MFQTYLVYRTTHCFLNKIDFRKLFKLEFISLVYVYNGSGVSVNILSSIATSQYYLQFDIN